MVSAVVYELGAIREVHELRVMEAVCKLGVVYKCEMAGYFAPKNPIKKIDEVYMFASLLYCWGFV